MSFKYLNMKLGVCALGLVAVMAGFSVLGIHEPVNAATPLVNCDASVSGRAQTCITRAATAKVGTAEVTDLVLLTPAAGQIKQTPTDSTAPKQELSAGSHMAETLVLFAVALVGIAFLGRRRKTSLHKN